MAKRKVESQIAKFDSRPLKVGNHSDFLMFRQHATYRCKALDEGYDIALDLISIRCLHRKLCALKVTKVPTLGISLGSPRTKCHLDVGLVERHKVYYKREGDGFYQVWAVVSLVNPNFAHGLS
jgi:hypothetical protein